MIGLESKDFRPGPKNYVFLNSFLDLKEARKVFLPGFLCSGMSDRSEVGDPAGMVLALVVWTSSSSRSSVRSARSSKGMRLNRVFRRVVVVSTLAGVVSNTPRLTRVVGPKVYKLPD